MLKCAFIIINFLILFKENLNEIPEIIYSEKEILRSWISVRITTKTLGSLCLKYDRGHVKQKRPVFALCLVNLYIFPCMKNNWTVLVIVL